MSPVTSNGHALGKRRRGDAPGMGGRRGKTVVRDRAGNRILWGIFRRDGPGGRFEIDQIVVRAQAAGFAFFWPHRGNPNRRRILTTEHQRSVLASSVFLRRCICAGAVDAISVWWCSPARL